MGEQEETLELFGLALGLVVPWQVRSVVFEKDVDKDAEHENGELKITLGYVRGSRFGCPCDGCSESSCPVHDTLEKTWRHLDFFQHRTLLCARVPRVSCPAHGVHLIDVAWARPGSGFTLLMEVAMLTFAKQMPIATLAAMAREHDTRIWRVIEHHIAVARTGLDLSGVSRLGMDETSARRGQDYVSIFMDLNSRRVIFATPGRDADAVKAFAADLAAHGGSPRTQIDQVCCDMSNAFISGIGAHLAEVPAKGDAGEPRYPDVSAPLPSPPTTNMTDQAPQADQALEVKVADPAPTPSQELHRPEIIFDRYHVVAKANEAVDKVRRAEAKTRPELKATRYVWLKNDAHLSAAQRAKLIWLSRPSMQLQTARAARWRDDFNEFYNKTTPEEAEAYLKRWCYGAKRSRLEPVKEFVRTVEAHWAGIIAWQTYRISNGLLEGTNSLIQAAKRRARGYRSKEKMITIIYLIAGKLPLPQIHTI